MLFLASCAKKELLQPYPVTIPGGVDLTGEWIINASSSASEDAIRAVVEKLDGVSTRSIVNNPYASSNPRRRMQPKQVRGGLVDVFFDYAEQLKITQNEFALFISFNRSVVEEYRYGRLDRVNVGQVAAQQVAGWSGQAFVIETLDDSDMKLSERYFIDVRSGELVREITFRSHSHQQETLEQRFSKVL